MPRIALTDRFVAGAKPNSEAQTDYFDVTVSGLALRVSKNHRAWTFNYTSPKDAKRARITLGNYPALPLAVARRKALEAKALVQDGKDPRHVFAAQQASALTVAGLIESYLKNHARPNLRSAKQMEARFAANVTPLIGAVALADLHRREMNTVLDAIVERGKPTMARIVFQDMRAMFRWAVGRGDLDGSPLEGASTPSTEKPRERVLTDQEIAALWNELPTSLPNSKACRWIISFAWSPPNVWARSPACVWMNST